MSGSRGRRLSASGRVLLAMTGMLTFTVAVLVAIAYGVTERALSSELDSTLRREAAAFSAALGSAPADEALVEAVRSYFAGRTAQGSGPDVVLLVSLPSGRTISNSQVRLESALDTPGSASSSSFRNVALAGVDYRVLSVPLRSQGRPAGVFHAAVAEQIADETARRVALTLGAAGLLALAVAMPLSYLATRRSLRPLRRMAEDSARVSYATPEHRIDYDGPDDELGVLAGTLNEMLDRLHAAYEDQRRFVADASHELRTPVAIIRGNAELLQSGRHSEQEQAESLSIIEDETVRMGRLLDDLLSLARFESLRITFEPVEVRTMLDELAARTRALGDRDVSVEGDCGLWTVGDRTLLEQALVNLMRNAIAQTDEGGCITFSCQRRDDRVAVSVSDDGPGIAAQDLDRVFDRFYRAPRQRAADSGGAGLGLAIARRIVELHGGTIVAENVEPHGARFTLELPLTTAPELPA